MKTALATLSLALVLAAPAAASQAPEELWRAYPLDPVSTTADGTSIPTPPPRLTPPFRQPDAPNAAVGTALTESSDGGLRSWLLVATALVVGALAVVVVRRRLEAIPARAAVDAWSRQSSKTRPHSQALGRFALAAEATRSPAPAAVACVVRREGGVRSRFVAELEPRTGARRTIASSRPYWRRRFGSGHTASDAHARQAWNDLMDGLEAEGWTVAPAWGARTEDVSRSSEPTDETRLVRAPRVPDEGADRAERSGGAEKKRPRQPQANRRRRGGKRRRR